MHSEIYLDANATSPVLPAAVKAATAAMDTCFGNPSSSHVTGLRARAVLGAAHAAARRVLGAYDGRVMFNSGATEGIQTAVLSALCAVRAQRARGQACGELVLIGATEHKAVPESLAHWNRLLGTGLELRVLPVDADGRHRLDVLRALAPRAAFICTMAANNETGVVSDLDGIEQVLRETASPALWMVDCVQALGKLPLTLSASRIDYAPFSGHKLYAPKGIGMLYVREGAPFTPLMCGGGQEGGQRSGTENMAGIAALGAVLQALEQGGTFRSHDQLQACRARLVAALRAAFPDVVFNAPLALALPTTLNFSVPGVASADLLEVFDAAGLRVSAGSACSASKAAPSYVLDAMGVANWRSASAVRMSFGPLIDDEDIERACERIAACARALQLPSLAPMQAGCAGLAQFDREGATGWLLFNAATSECIAIDLAPAPLEQAQAMLNGYRLLASVSSASRHGAPVIALGDEALVREGDVWRFGRLDNGVLAPQAARFVFSAGGVAIAGTLRHHQGQQGQQAHHAGSMELGPDAARRHLAQHPDTLIVDVRCLREAGAGPISLNGQAALNVPLARLVEHAALWLDDDARSLLFVCRSGARSARAARTLRQLGHPRAWSLAGGIALAD